jgi:lysophospholipase L1-like esterase
MRLRLAAAGAAATALALLASCGGGSTNGPDPVPSTGGSADVSVVVFYDENANGTMDGSESVRLPDVVVRVGAMTSRTAGGTGRASFGSVASGSQTATVDATTLPAFYTAAPVTFQVPAAREILVPARLSIGSNRPNTYVAFGDSITEGRNFPGDDAYLGDLESRLRGRFGGSPAIINEGLGSTRSNQGADRIPGVLSADRPAYTLIMYGTNDWNRSECNRVDRLNTSCFTIPSLRAIVRSVKAAGSLPVLATIPPCNEGFSIFAPPQRNQWVVAANVQVRDMARQEGAALADVEASFFGYGRYEDLFVDHVHPNAQGQERIAEAFFQAISRPVGASGSFDGAAALQASRARRGLFLTPGPESPLE